jgi:molybdopterin molybdotransferase
MLSPDEALRIILEHVPRAPVEDCPLSQAHQRVLRAPVAADRPMPPFDRVTMDGFALRAEAVAAGRRHFRIAGTQAAGTRPLELTSDEGCIEIATGAVLPVGTDTVVPYEETERTGDTVTLTAPDEVAAGRNLHRRGSDCPTGNELLPVGTRLAGGEVAVAAACGAAFLRVSARPRIAVVATGDELVEVDARDLAPHQIRKSNDYALRAALLGSGWTQRVERFHLRDHRSDIEQGLRQLLAEWDVILLTGGVSKGKFDFVPQVLADLGVEQKVRGVAQRPGKPMWFGISPRRTPVFALPGNPISAYTCLHRYVLPALTHQAGAAPAAEASAILAQPVTFKPPLAYLLPVRTTTSPDGRHVATPLPFNTSGDLAGLIGTTGFIELPADQTDFPAGTIARYWSWTF